MVAPATVLVATPDKPSSHPKLAVTLWLFQPYEFAAGERLPVMTGFALSMLMSVTVTASAPLPALSVQPPVFVTDWCVPSAVTVAPSTVSLASPDKASAHVNETVTFSLFQPVAFAAGERLPAIAGLVLSMLMPPTVAELALLPALSAQPPLFVTDWSLPSALTVPPATVSAATPDNPSSQA